jgi:uncharacterized protein (DUF2237 family)
MFWKQYILARCCLCASRWQDVQEASMATPIVLEATYTSTLEYLPLDDLKAHTIV